MNFRNLSLRELVNFAKNGSPTQQMGAKIEIQQRTVVEVENELVHNNMLDFAGFTLEALESFGGDTDAVAVIVDRAIGLRLGRIDEFGFFLRGS